MERMALKFPPAYYCFTGVKELAEYISSMGWVGLGYENWTHVHV